MVQSLKVRIKNIGKNSKEASRELYRLGTLEKNKILKSIQISIEKNKLDILNGNAIDIKNGKTQVYQKDCWIDCI